MPPGPGEDRTPLLKIGRELFDGLTAAGDVVTFVCFEHGYGVRRNGQLVPGCWWDSDRVDEALAAFKGLANPVARSAAPPAA